MAHYYLVASLPSLELDGKLPWTAAEFLRACENALESEDLAEVMMALEGREAQARHGSLRRWHWRETQLRNAVARHRASKLGGEHPSAPREHGEFDVGIERGVSEAMRLSDPLEREKALDLLRWRMSEEMATGEPFGLGAVLGHALKLRLASRWHSMEEQQGRRTIAEMVEKRLEGLSAGQGKGGGGR